MGANESNQIGGYVGPAPYLKLSTTIDAINNSLSAEKTDGLYRSMSINNIVYASMKDEWRNIVCVLQSPEALLIQKAALSLDLMEAAPTKKETKSIIYENMKNALALSVDKETLKSVVGSKLCFKDEFLVCVIKEAARMITKLNDAVMKSDMKSSDFKDITSVSYIISLAANKSSK